MINVVGLGYIGLPTALMFAAHGENVVVSDRRSGNKGALSQSSS